MASKVEVLCPNGHRVTIKTNPNTTILQILEEACAKKGFIADEHDLKHGRRSLDLSMSIRYAGLPNLAKLEMVAATSSRQEQDVVVAVQLLDGSRVQHTFSPKTPLWEVLQHFDQNRMEGEKLCCVKEVGHHPVCVYMSEEVIGQEALSATTLRKLGLTSGKAVIRYQQREISEDVLARIHDQLEKSKMKATTNTQRTSVRQPHPQTDLAIHDNASNQNRENLSFERAKINAAATSAPFQHPSASPFNTSRRGMPQIPESPKEGGVQNLGKDASKESSGSQNQTAVKTRKGISKSQPEAMEASSSNQDTEKLEATRSDPCEPMEIVDDQQPSGSSQDPIDALNQVPGIQVFRPGDLAKMGLTPEQEALAREKAQAFVMEMMGLGTPANNNTATHKKQQQQRQQQQQQQQNEFQNFRFPQSSRDQNINQNIKSEANKEAYKPCDREVVLYDIDDQPSQSHAKMEEDEDLPDEFFDVTEADVRRMWSDLQRKIRDRDNAPLMTEAMRQQKLDDRYSKYERVAIRFHFPDKIILQALFRPKETVYALEKFVKNHLQNKELPFYLYTTPPKNVLNDKYQTLIEARLAPMSVVYFGSDEKQDHYLKSELLSQKASQETANITLLKYLQSSHSSTSSHTDDYLPEPGSSSSSSSTSMEASTSSQTKRTASANTSDPSKVPKWFKVGRK